MSKTANSISKLKSAYSSTAEVVFYFIMQQLSVAMFIVFKSSLKVFRHGVGRFTLYAVDM